MVDITMIAEAVTSLKTASDIAKTLIGLRDTQAIQSKVAELNGIILSAQSSALAAQSNQFALLDRIRCLEKEIADLEAWDREKERYQLKDAGNGSLAYILKENAGGAEPSHQICAACYQHARKSILQPRTKASEKLLFCPDCKTEIKIGYQAPGTACPKCGAPAYRVDRSEEHRTFGDLGARVHYMKCHECGFTDEKLVK